MFDDWSDDERASLARRMNAVPVWYHTIDLGLGLLTPGVYDMRPHLDAYGFPTSMHGLDVLDVGAANGYFSFEFERRGAHRIVATDLASVLDHDVPSWYREEKLANITTEELARLNHEQLEAGFDLAHEARRSRVEKVRCTIYELPVRIGGKFDAVFCGNLLHHLRDPVGAIEAIREVMKPSGVMILAFSSDLNADESYAVFAGNPEDVAWWIFSRPAALRMCRLAGFRSVEWKGAFTFAPTGSPQRIGYQGIIHARRD